MKRRWTLQLPHRSRGRRGTPLARTRPGLVAVSAVRAGVPRPPARPGRFVPLPPASEPRTQERSAALRPRELRASAGTPRTRLARTPRWLRRGSRRARRGACARRAGTARPRELRWLVRARAGSGRSARARGSPPRNPRHAEARDRGRRTPGPPSPVRGGAAVGRSRSRRAARETGAWRHPPHRRVPAGSRRRRSRPVARRETPGVDATVRVAAEPGV